MSSIKRMLNFKIFFRRSLDPPPRILCARTVVLAAALLMISGCGSFQVSLESSAEITTSEPERPSATQPPQVGLEQPRQFGLDGAGPFFFDAPYGSVLDETQTVLLVHDGLAAFDQNPVYMEMLWDYSGPTGKAAYASEFFHASQAFSRSVSDLWVYDYTSDTAELWLKDDVSRAA